MFNDSERELLLEILQKDYDGLRVEINRTDTLEYKRSLRDRERIMESVLRKLDAPRLREQPGGTAFPAQERQL